jgi:hypothetical protein
MSEETQVVQSGLEAQAGAILSPGELALIAQRHGLKVYQPVPSDKLAQARFIGLDVHLSAARQASTI